MKIYRQFKGENTSKQVSLETFLHYTEGSGFWQKGTALETLKQAGVIHTSFAIYKLNKQI